MDWDTVEKLVRIIDTLRGHPNLKPLADQAMHELEQLAHPPVEVDEGEPDEEEGEDE